MSRLFSPSGPSRPARGAWRAPRSSERSALGSGGGRGPRGGVGRWRRREKEAGPAGGCGPASWRRGFSRTLLTQLHAGTLQPVGSLQPWEARRLGYRLLGGSPSPALGSAHLLNLTGILVKVQQAWGCAFPAHSPGSAALRPHCSKPSSPNPSHFCGPPWGRAVCAPPLVLLPPLQRGQHLASSSRKQGTNKERRERNRGSAHPCPNRGRVHSPGRCWCL